MTQAMVGSSHVVGGGADSVCLVHDELRFVVQPFDGAVIGRYLEARLPAKQSVRDHGERALGYYHRQLFVLLGDRLSSQRWLPGTTRLAPLRSEGWGKG